MDASWIKQHGEDCSVSIFVQAGAKTSEIVGLHGDSLKIRVAAPRTEGLANEALLDYVAELLSVSKRDISFLKGEFGKQKILKIRKATVDDLVLKVQKRVLLTKGSKK